MNDLSLPIYLDYNASTPTDPKVLEEMIPYFSSKFGNPSSIDHYFGSEAQKGVALARERLASLLGCNPSEIIFTSGASEADNLAIIGCAKANPEKRKIITSAIEHKAVLRSVEYLSKNGYESTILPVDTYGLVSPDDLRDAIDENTLLVSIMMANNEIGTIQPIVKLATIAHEFGAFFHTDAAQGVGYLNVDLTQNDIDLLSLSGHKMYGPKGIGALVIRRRSPRVKIEPLIYGGGHERGIRSGTLNVPGIVGLGKASEISKTLLSTEKKRLESLRNHFFSSLKSSLDEIIINGHSKKRLPHNLNLCIPGVRNKALQYSLREELAFSTGSACETGNVQSSHVLSALGLDE